MNRGLQDTEDLFPFGPTARTVLNRLYEKDSIGILEAFNTYNANLYGGLVRTLTRANEVTFVNVSNFALIKASLRGLNLRPIKNLNFNIKHSHTIGALRIAAFYLYCLSLLLEVMMNCDDRVLWANRAIVAI